MLNYQWLIANCPTPNRRVDASRVAVGNTQEWNAIHQHELETPDTIFVGFKKGKEFVIAY